MSDPRFNELHPPDPDCTNCKGAGYVIVPAGRNTGTFVCRCRRMFDTLDGSSVPEAAMEAAYDAAAGYWSDGGYTAPVEAAVHAAAPFIVAAAVAEERATTGRRVQQLIDHLVTARGKVPQGSHDPRDLPAHEFWRGYSNATDEAIDVLRAALAGELDPT